MLTGLLDLSGIDLQALYHIAVTRPQRRCERPVTAADVDNQPALNPALFEYFARRLLGGFSLRKAWRHQQQSDCSDHEVMSGRHSMISFYGYAFFGFSRNSRKPEGHKPESPAVQALGRRIATKDTKAQRAVTSGLGPLGLGNILSLSPIPGLAPLGFRVPAFQAAGIRGSRNSPKSLSIFC